jgi:hypothetical protein
MDETCVHHFDLDKKKTSNNTLIAGKVTTKVFWDSGGSL